MELFLIKHGECVQSARDNFKVSLPDHKVYLSSKGERESNDAGIFLKKYLEEKNINIENAVIWTSPFLRARQTADIISQYLGKSDIIEDYALIDQRFGLFSDRSAGRNRMEFQKEFEYYDNLCQSDGKFYAKVPQGEAAMDVAIRTRLFLDMVSRYNSSPIFIVSHDTPIKTIVMNTLHYSPSWFNAEPDMENCSIRIINSDTKKDEFIYGSSIKKLKF